MSLILAGGNKDFMIVGGEQRVLNKAGMVISEHYRKVFKINEDFIVAFAGKVRYCEEILKPVLERKGEKGHPLANAELVDLIEKRAKGAKERLEETKEDCFFGIIVCGKTFHGRPKDPKNNPYFMQLYTYDGDLSISKKTFRDSGISWAALYGNRYNHKKVCKELFVRKKALNLKDTREVFDQTFMNGARHDKTMNNKVLYEILED